MGGGHTCRHQSRIEENHQLPFIHSEQKTKNANEKIFVIESKRLTWPLKDFELPWWRRRNCREISVDRCGQRSVARRASNCWRRWPAGCDSRPPPGASAATPPAAGSRPFTNKMQQNVNKTNARPSFNGLVFHRKTLKRQKKKFEFRYKSPRWDFMTMKSNDSPDMHKWVHRTCRWPCSKHPNWLAGWVSSRAQSAGRDKTKFNEVQCRATRPSTAFCSN